ncbi:Ktr system potassium uptake protein A [Acaryochloris thomasi RCC1774]|uniref:Ktr system potassium uptake protein A n=1 Tax=Acaryochloris thomasi RCC1774 TaxID=1764569 RepID=A0A2W1K2N2_9CYAN|nr:TrkA family potassium uptake protein [Acaryochloris thomasi]PZD74297.1 Ktr system potassium uptake protein A [Acaryochloris thomasi RCC1774]
MNLSSFSFLQGLQPKNQQFAVIGLGRFGRAVCESLHHSGYEVLGADVDEKLVAEALSCQIAAHALQLDSTDPLALKEAGFYEFDTVIIAIGNYLQESIITTLNMKEAGVTNVVAKASSEVHGKLLKRVGADRVVFPEYEAGCALAKSLTKPGILERFELDPEHSIVELLIPKEFHGKTLAELELRNRYGLNVLAVGREKMFEINPAPELRLLQDAMMVVIGDNEAIEQLPL